MYPYCKYFNQSLPKTFKNWFILATASHAHNTRWSNSSCLKVPSHNTKLCGRHSVSISVTCTRNYLQKLHVNILFYKLPLTKLKSLRVWLKNSILLVMTKDLMYYALVYFCLFHHKKVSFVIYLFRVILPVLALLCGNCPLTSKLRSYFAFL